MPDQNTLIAGVPLVGLVIMLCQISKAWIPSKWIPLVSLALGIGLVAFAKQTFDVEIILLGLAVGFSASGGFSSGRALAKKK